MIVLWCCNWLFVCLVCFFFFKQKTAYEMRISDWSSDVCSSDLETRMRDYADDIGIAARQLGRAPVLIGWGMGALAALLYAQTRPVLGLVQIGRASCRERVCQYV